MQQGSGSKLFVIEKDGECSGHEIVCYGFRKEIIAEYHVLKKADSDTQFYTWRKAEHQDSLRDVPHVKKFKQAWRPVILNR